MMQKWHKEGDFNLVSNKEYQLLNRRVSYQYPDNDLIIKIHIFGYKDTSNLTIWFSIKNCSGESSGLEAANSLFMKFKEASKKFKIRSLIAIDNDLQDLGSVRVFISSSDKELFANFVNAVDSAVSFDKQTKQEIFDTLGIKAIADEIAFYAELKELVDAGSFQEALDKVLKTEDESMLIKLAEYCEELQQWQDAITCYNHIAASSSYSPQANGKIAHIYMQIQLCAEMSNVQISAVEKQQYKEQELRHLLNTESDHQSLIDRLFQELSGEGLGKDPEISNVRLNADTLIKLASQAKKLRQEIATLKAAYSELEEKLQLNNTTTSLPISSALSNTWIFNNSIQKIEGDNNNNNNTFGNK